MRDKPSIVAIAHTGPSKLAFTGGALRANRSLKEYSKHFNVYLILPPTCTSLSYSNVDSLRSELKPRDIVILDTYLKPILSSTPLSFTYLLIPQKLLRLTLKGFENLITKQSVIVVLNEIPECLKIGSMIKSKLESPALALLQLPLFYHEKRRRENISRALRLWYEELYKGKYIDMLVGMNIANLRLSIEQSKLLKNILKDYDILLAISRAIPHEMGPEWSCKLYALDPGVSLNEDDLELINKIKENTVKQEYIVFGGRVNPLKGFVEGLYAFKHLVKHNPLLKLVITGHINAKLRTKIDVLSRRLGLEGKVVLTGQLPRIERFRIVANARLMLYPSHIDSFSYSVLESLYLGTPIVAYDIPALRIYYGSNPCVKLVEEGDIEALTVEALNLLKSKDITIEKPKLRKWEEILKEEVMLINKFISRG